MIIPNWEEYYENLKKLDNKSHNPWDSVPLLDEIPLIFAEKQNDIKKNQTVIQDFICKECGPDSIEIIGLAENYRLPKGNLIIPSMLNNKIVKQIGESAFKNNQKIKHVIFPNQLECIKAMAFSGCRNLIEINIPSKVNQIEEYAFEDCDNLKNIILPIGLHTIEESTFANCQALTSIVLPDTITTIKKGAFEFCENLSNVKLSKNLTNIGNFSFSSCGSLKNIKLPKTLKRIGKYTFDFSVNISCCPNSPIIDYLKKYNLSYVERGESALADFLQDTSLERKT